MIRTLSKLTWIELKLLLREPFTVLFVFAFPLVVLVVIAGVFGSEPSAEFRGAKPADFYVAGYIATVIAALTLVGMPVHLANYRERAILRRFAASSVPAWVVLGSQMLVGLILAIASSLALVVVAALAYDISRPGSIAGVVLAFLVGVLSFLCLGIFLGTLFPTARAAQAAGLGLFFPLWMLSGAGPPRDVLSNGMRRVSDVLPMTHLVTALQDPWIGLGTNLTELAILFGILVVAGVIALRLSRFV